MHRLSLVLPLFLASLGAVSGFEPEDLSILAVENETGYDIIALYLYPAGGDYSGPDLLTGGRFIARGDEESFFLYFEEGSAEKSFDLLAVDTEGYQYRLAGLRSSADSPLSAALTVRHHIPFPPPLETVDIEVRNSTVPIFFLFMRPPESGWWGASVLGPEEMLMSSRTLTLSVPSLGAAVPYELLAVDEDFDEYSIDVTVEPAGAAKQPDFEGMTAPAVTTGDQPAKDASRLPEKGVPEISIQLDDLKERQ